MENLFIYSFAIAFISVVYRCILSKEKILNWWFMFGLRFENRFFYKPIWGCEFCFAGQLAFWIYLLNVIFGIIINKSLLISHFIFILIPNYHLKEINVFWGVFSVSFSILLTFILGQLIEKLKK